jgi:hypothetical protein
MVLLMGGCDKELHELNMSKTPYTGNELRIDGYYYTTVHSNYSNIGVGVFYRDGVCMFFHVDIDGKDTISCIENEILLNHSLMRSSWDTPDGVGLFQINGQSIKIVVWSEDYHEIETLNYKGEIINDSTFKITKADLISEETVSVNHIYRFKKFSPKPDSTNKYLKIMRRY